MFLNIFLQLVRRYRDKDLKEYKQYFCYFDHCAAFQTNRDSGQKHKREGIDNGS